METEEKAPTYIIGISFVGGADYLKRALASIGDKHLHNVRVVNSSDPLDLQWKHWETWYEIVPSVPLSHTQTHNWFQVEATDMDALFVCHNDAEAEPDTIDKLLAMLPTLPKKWGVVFTNYDALAMYNPKMWKAIGHWNWRLYPSYYSDTSYYFQARMAGWQLIDSGLPVKHEGSHVINKLDKKLKFLNHTLLADAARNNFIAEWGGPPGEERFTRPFNGLLENPYPDS